MIAERTAVKNTDGGWNTKCSSLGTTPTVISQLYVYCKNLKHSIFI